MVKQSKRKEYRVEQYYAIRQIFGMSLSPDGQTVGYITNTDGLPNVWTIPIDGGWTSQVSLEENAVKAIEYSPKKNEIIFHSDINGDENTQLYLISDKGGESIPPQHHERRRDHRRTTIATASHTVSPAPTTYRRRRRRCPRATARGRPPRTSIRPW